MREENLNETTTAAAASVEMRRLRVDVLKITQAELAEILDVDVKTISAWERGKNTPSPLACSHLDAYNGWPEGTSRRAFRDGTPLPAPTSSVPGWIEAAAPVTAASADPLAALAAVVGRLEAHSVRQDARLDEQDALLNALALQLDRLSATAPRAARRSS